MNDAARIIMDGISRKQKHIAFPFYVKILATLYQLFPDLFFAMNLEQIRKFRSIRRES